MASKHDRKDEQHDLDLGEVYSRTELFLEKNKRAVSMAVTGILVVVAAVLGYKRFYAEPRAKEAADLIWKAQYYFEIDSLDLAINGDGNYFGFQYIADEYGSTPSGELAKYYLGNCYLQKGDFGTAIDYFKKADLDDDILSVMAVGCIGDAYVQLDQPKEAIDQFEKAANMRTNDMTTPMYLMKAGILYQQNGDWAKAAKAFRRVAKDFPASPDANQAKKYAARAEAMAG
ncbi:MAG: tetratricopeptide repeat protein [Flavobacteriales bacterium]|nr:tetratricopeptide repeat protein [Flavobacteriales bacterium]MCB9168311.1 tetratricopeptide repeat protein [Flavobacteriales bacterium]